MESSSCDKALIFFPQHFHRASDPLISRIHPSYLFTVIFLDLPGIRMIVRYRELPKGQYPSILQHFWVAWRSWSTYLV